MPGHVFPFESPRPTQSQGEIKVHEALKRQLPDGWHAWHSLRLRVGGDWEGEGDFVVAAPGRGLLVLEVKSGQMELRGGLWFQNGRKLERAPREQALGFVRRLVDAVIRKGGERPPFGVASFFPDVDFTEPPGSGDLQDVVLGGRDLAWLGEALVKTMDRALPSHPAPVTAKWIRILHELWGETWVPTVRLDDRAEDFDRRAVALNAEQLRALDVADENLRAVVTGAAGTGKTLVAAELCRRWAKRGKRALFFCFTDALAKAVDEQFARDFPRERRPRAVPLRRYARELLERSGHGVNPNATDFWEEVSLNAACDALPAEAERPDLVVIDEAQDLQESDWVLVEQLAENRGLWVFYDPLQAFWTDRPLPSFVCDCLARLRLPTQMRNPEPVARFAALYGDEAQTDAFGARVDPGTLKLVIAPADALSDRVRHEIDVLRKNGARPSDIAIISLGGQLRSHLFQKPQLGSYRLVHADDPEAGSHVIADTFLRFKGLERPFIIVTEVDGAMPRYAARMRIAVTRATVGLTIVCAAEQVEADPRLGALRPAG